MIMVQGQQILKFEIIQLQFIIAYYKQRINMIRHKNQRINLKSSIYKDRSPSPFSPNVQNSHSYYRKNIQLRNSKPNMNVCCPNCKYLFKVFSQKNYQVSQSIDNKTPPKNNHLSQVQLFTSMKNSRNVFTQTENQIQSNKVSPKIQKFKTENTRSIMAKYYQDKILSARNNEHFQQALSSLRNKSPKKQKQPLSNRLLQKIENQRKKKLGTDYPDKSIYMIQTPKQISSQSKSPNRYEQSLDMTMHYFKEKMRQHEQQSRKKQIDITEVNELLNQIYLSSEIMEILNYQLDNLDVENNVPSYYKMLIYELEDKKNSYSGTLK